MKKILIGLATILSLSSHAYATNLTTNIQSNAVLASSCSISLPFNANYGNITPGPTGRIKIVVFNVQCTKTTPYTVSFGYGISGASNRYMLGSSSNDHLTYNIYTAGYTTIYGDGTNGTTTYSATADGTLQGTSMFVKIDGNQYPSPDNYSDTVTLTVMY